MDNNVVADTCKRNIKVKAKVSGFYTAFKDSAIPWRLRYSDFEWRKKVMVYLCHGFTFVHPLITAKYLGLPGVSKSNSCRPYANFNAYAPEVLCESFIRSVVNSMSNVPPR